jgi:hypothetical protein
MRAVILAVPLIFAATASQAQSVQFRGGIVTTQASTACAQDNFGTGDFGVIRYAPRGLGSNGNDDKLSIFYTSFASNYTLVGSSFTNTFAKVKGTAVGRSGFGFNAALSVQISPSTITSSTEFVTMKGQIKNFGGTKNCTILFNAAMPRRP